MAWRQQPREAVAASLAVCMAEVEEARHKSARAVKWASGCGHYPWEEQQNPGNLGLEELLVYARPAEDMLCDAWVIQGVDRFIE